MRRMGSASRWVVLHGERPHAKQSSGTVMLYISSMSQLPIQTSTWDEKQVRLVLLVVELLRIPVELLKVELVVDDIGIEGPCSESARPIAFSLACHSLRKW